MIEASVFVTKSACFNFTLKRSAAKVLNFGNVVYLSWLWSVKFFSISEIFVPYSVFFFSTKLLVLGILFSTTVNAEVIAKH